MKIDAHPHDDGILLVAESVKGETKEYLAKVGSPIYEQATSEQRIHSSSVIYHLTNGGQKTHPFATFLQEGDSGFRPRRTRKKGWEKQAGLSDGTEYRHVHRPGDVTVHGTLARATIRVESEK